MRMDDTIILIRRRRMIRSKTPCGWRHRRIQHEWFLSWSSKSSLMMTVGADRTRCGTMVLWWWWLRWMRPNSCVVAGCCGCLLRRRHPTNASDRIVIHTQLLQLQQQRFATMSVVRIYPPMLLFQHDVGSSGWKQGATRGRNQRVVRTLAGTWSTRHAHAVT